MLSYETVGPQRRPQRRRWIGYALLVLAGSVLSTMFSPLSRQVQAGSGTGVVLFLLVMLAWIALPASLWWRHRRPFTLVAVGAVLPLLLPVGNTFVLVALACLLGRRRGPATWLAVGGVALTSGAVTLLDAFAQPRGASLAKSIFGSSPIAKPTDLVPAPLVESLTAWAIGLAVAVGAGLVVRSRRETAAAQESAKSVEAASLQLGDEVARRAEREQIAREVHDALGHRLSLLTLHAGALEANAEDPHLVESARLVRASATEAMDDLRSLLAVLREPLADAKALPLSQLSEVIDASFGAGQPLNSTVFISDADSADPTLARAVYRITQELLTNARKHAPGQLTQLRVHGSPATGIVIDARNALGAQGADSAGASRGLAGISERAELLGGRVLHGVERDGTFHVHVELPWRTGHAG